MYFLALALLAVVTVNAAEEPQPALVARAQADFDRVQKEGAPQIKDAAACVQSQASLLSVALPSEAPIMRYRKGYCALAGATVTHEKRDYSAAASELEKAAATWTDFSQNPKNKNPQPVPAGLQALAWVARIKAGDEKAATPPVRSDIDITIEKGVCPGAEMTVADCQAALRTARQWLGRLALDSGDLYEAGKYFEATPGWRQWVGGKTAFRDRKYPEAAKQYRSALDYWADEAKAEPASLMERLAPQPDMSGTLAELGGAEVLAGDPNKAVATLDEAVKLNPAHSRALYLRALAKEAAGRKDDAIADFNLASRTAFAHAEDDASSGAAHLYRGIALYLRKDYTHAEDEFASALNFDIAANLRPDAEAWRQMAAVAAGYCGDSRERLERALETASPFFPRQGARAMAMACMASGTTVTASRAGETPQ